VLSALPLQSILFRGLGCCDLETPEDKKSTAAALVSSFFTVRLISIALKILSLCLYSTDMSAPSLSSIFPDSTVLRHNTIVDLSFLSPNANVSSLINNSTFTNTLQCAIVTSDGLQNASCLQACGNITDLFSSWPNFYTCSWYPALSGFLTENPNVSTAASLETLGINGHQEDLTSNISSNIATCLADYCQSSPQCQLLDSSQACSSASLISVNGSSKTLNQSSAASCLRYGVCGTTDDVNPDIGGLGVGEQTLQASTF
jgi:hypothetical protein